MGGQQRYGSRLAYEGQDKAKPSESDDDARHVDHSRIRRHLAQGLQRTACRRLRYQALVFFQFEGTLVLTRLLTRRLHVSSLSVCRHCVAHHASLFVVKPHGPGRLKTEASSRPGFIDLHLAHSTSSPQSIPTSLSHRLSLLLSSYIAAALEAFGCSGP